MTPRLSSSKAAAIRAALACAMFPAASSADHEKIPVEPLARYAKLDPSGVTVSGSRPALSSRTSFTSPTRASSKARGSSPAAPTAAPTKLTASRRRSATHLSWPSCPAGSSSSLAVCTHFGRSDFKEAGWHSPEQAGCKGLTAGCRARLASRGRSTTLPIWLVAGFGSFTATRTPASRNRPCKSLRISTGSQGYPRRASRSETGLTPSTGCPSRSLRPAIPVSIAGSPIHPF